MRIPLLHIRKHVSLSDKAMLHCTRHLSKSCVTALSNQCLLQFVRCLSGSCISVPGHLTFRRDSVSRQGQIPGHQSSIHQQHLNVTFRGGFLSCHGQTFHYSCFPVYQNRSPLHTRYNRDSYLNSRKVNQFHHRYAHMFSRKNDSNKKFLRRTPSFQQQQHLKLTPQGILESSPEVLQPYMRLIRFDKPIGTWLLYWPCTWSIALATDPGCLPSLYLLTLFGMGSFFMRGAGCIINDMWDKDFDRKVERTKLRPLASGELSNFQGLVCLGGMLSVSLAILLQLNWYSVFIGAASMGLVITYPLAKRYTYWPQALLGVTLNWGVLIAWSSINGCLQSPVYPLYLACVLYTMIYDSIYSHQDKYDDMLIGVKSTALKFGDKTKHWLSGFGVVMISGLVTSGIMCNQTWPYYLGVTLTTTHLAHQLYTVDLDNPDDCARKFRSNTQLGCVMFLGIVFGTLLKKKDTKSEEKDTNPRQQYFSYIAAVKYYKCFLHCSVEGRLPTYTDSCYVAQLSPRGGPPSKIARFITSSVFKIYVTVNIRARRGRYDHLFYFVAVMGILGIIWLASILCLVEGSHPHSSIKTKVASFLKSNPWKHLHTSFRITHPMLIDIISKYRYPDINTRKSKDCAEILQKQKYAQDGVYSIYPSRRSGAVEVYCDMTTDGGGWTVIQRRFDGSTNFSRNWIAYKKGFGSPDKEYWLGNDYIHLLTKKGDYELRVDMERFSGKKAYARYSRFLIGDENAKYRLHISGYKGTAGDALRYHNGKQFTTKDRDNDENRINCAVRSSGAWWYKSCFRSNLNGNYYKSKGLYDYRGMAWYHWGSNFRAKKSSKMMIRPKL